MLVRDAYPTTVTFRIDEAPLPLARPFSDIVQQTTMSGERSRAEDLAKGTCT
ncbi:hypothetical protein GCM10018965_068030 [Nonomuraea roseola]